MKFNQVVHRPLIESYIRNNNATTASYMQAMNENFVIPFNKNLRLLAEAEMTADQVQQVFGYAEKIASAGGDNKTLLGKGATAAAAGAKAVGQGAADLAKKGAAGIKQLADKILKQNQANFEKSLPPADAGPVENFEQQAAQAAEQIQDPKAKQSVMDLIKQATKNPVTQTLVLAAVGGIATIVAGPAIAGLGLGIAATGALTGGVVGGLTGVVRGAMQGQGLKGALKQGAMGAGLGALGGGVAGAVAQGAQAYMQNKNQQQMQLPAADQTQNDAAVTKAADEWAAADPAQRAEIEKVTGMTPQQLQSKIPANPVSATSTALPDGTPIERTTGNSSPEYMKQFGGDQPNQGAVAPSAPAEPTTQPATTGFQEVSPDRGDVTTQLKDLVAQGYSVTRSQTDPSMISVTDSSGNLMQQFNPGNPFLASRIASAANGISIRGIQQQGRVHTGTPVIEYIDRELTARMWILHESVGKPRGGVHLTEAGIGDMFKKAGNWLKTKASNLTNKVTADKLQQAWTKAGSPTESTQVAAIMAQAGVPQDSVNQIFKNMGIPNAPANPTTEPQGRVEPTLEPQGQASASAPQQPSGTTRTVSRTAPATASTPAEPSTFADKARGVGDTVAGGINSVSDALRAGDGMGTAGRSLMQTGTQSKNALTIKDAQGQEHDYKKVGQQWFDKDNKPVNAAQAAMLDKQAEQQAALGKAASPMTGPKGQIPGAKPPAAVKQVPGTPAAQTQQGAAQPAADPRDLNKDGTVDATEKSIARNKAKTPGAAQPATAQSPEEIRKTKQAAAATAAQGQMAATPVPAQQPATAAAQGQEFKDITGGKFNMDTGKPFASQAEADAQSARMEADPEYMALRNQELAQRKAQEQQPAQTGQAAVWKNNRAPEGTPAGTSPADAAAKVNTGNDVMARMAKQLAAPTTPAPATTPNFGQQQTGYASVKTNVTTGVPQQPAVQPTTGAKAVPVQPTAAPAAAPAAAPTASAQADANKPGFLQSKIKGSQVPAKQPEMAGTDFSAMLARKAKIKL